MQSEKFFDFLFRQRKRFTRKAQQSTAWLLRMPNFGYVDAGADFVRHWHTPSI
jgi:hypothetical protein